MWFWKTICYLVFIFSIKTKNTASYFFSFEGVPLNLFNVPRVPWDQKSFNLGFTFKKKLREILYQIWVFRLLFKLFSFGKCEKYANYREKFSFTRKVKVTCFCNSFVKSLTIFNLFKFTKSWQIGIGSQVNITETYNTPSQKNYMNNLNDGFINPPIKRIKRKITQIKPNVVFSRKYDKVAIFYSRKK